MLSLVLISLVQLARAEVPPSEVVSFIADPQKQAIEVHWKDDHGKILGTLEKLIAWQKTKKRQVLFAANGGMFTDTFSPLGLYIENGKELRPLIRKRTGYGNFYLQPNGVFAIGKNHVAQVVASGDFKKRDIEFATQSGPMLVHQGQINGHFAADSKNLNIRNGVGILPDGKVLFAESKAPITLYNFAEFFKKQGCLEALYLDGSVSQTYLPEKGLNQIYGPLGVLISVTKNGPSPAK